MIELGIFIARHGLAIAADLAEQFDPHQRVMTVLDEAPHSNMAVSRAAGAQNAVLRCRSRQLEALPSDRLHRHHDRRRIVAVRSIEQARGVVVGIEAVRVDPQQPIMPGAIFAHGQIDPRALDTGRIFEQHYPVGLCHLRNDGTAAVSASAIGHDQEVDGRIGQHLCEKLRQMLFLVEARDDSEHAHL